MYFGLWGTVECSLLPDHPLALPPAFIGCFVLSQESKAHKVKLQGDKHPKHSQYNILFTSGKIVIITLILRSFAW